MRVSTDPCDPDYLGDGHPGMDVLLDKRFFALGPVYEADEQKGVVVYAPVRNGIVETNPDGSWKRETIRGEVMLFARASKFNA